MYKCERCGYSSKYKGNLVTHLKRKRICKPILKDIEINKLFIKLISVSNNSKNVSNNSKNVGVNQKM